MDGVFLKGWGLDGLVPSVSGLSSGPKPARVLFVGPIRAKPGQLLRVPRVIQCTNAAPAGGFGPDVTAERARIASLLAAVNSRTMAAMPDAYAGGGDSFSFESDAAYAFLPIPQQWYQSVGGTPTYFPTLSCNLLVIYIGTASYTVDESGNVVPYTADLAGFLNEVVAGLPTMHGYTIRIFEWNPGAWAPSTQPGVNDAIQYAVSYLDSAVELAASLQLDVQIVGETSDATEDSVAQIIFDHYGVTI
jgi:hypothetical protein